MKDSNSRIKNSKSRHVIITGGGSVLGHDLATRYLMSGARVSVLDLHISEEQQDKLVSIAKDSSGGCLFLNTDVTVSETVN
jgi:NAD(P)-dependent dehydrogenase (short-subunit alcohol dehydrogenase family)